MTVLGRIRILPLLILVAMLSFAVRIGDVATGARALSGGAMAQEEVDAQPPAMPIPAQAKQDKPEGEDAAAPAAEKKAGEGDAKAEGKEDAAPGEKAEAEPKQEWRDPGEDEIDSSRVRMELFEDLAERRKDLETRERQLATREALLLAAEQEIDQKFRELQVLRKEIEALLKQQSDEELARIGSLVKIYEGMKAKDAARIFDTLDINVLISVVSRMSERKSSAILAEMNADRAREVTILLAQQKQLPELPQE